MTTIRGSGQAAPRFKTKSDNFVDLTRDTFRDKSMSLWQRFESERRANQHNMEAGLPLEDYFRQEFGAMLHEPYSVGNGKIVDHQQYTCGDCDFVIYDRRLAPLLRPPATSDSRRKFFAFETTYGIVEVKSTLTLGALEDGALRAKPKGTLWEACTKIFAYKELHRAAPQAFVWGSNRPIGVVFFYNCDVDTSIQAERDALLAEFAAINMSVPTELRANAVYVLNKFSLSWGFMMEVSRDRPVFLNLQHAAESPHPMWATYCPTGEDTLYQMYTTLWSTLARTQLVAPDLLNEYGAETYLRNHGYRSLPASIESRAELFALQSTDRAEEVIAHMRGDYERVAQLLRKKIDKDPFDKAALLRLANFSYLMKGDNDAATHLFQAAISKYPDDLDVTSGYAHFLAAQKNVARGEAVLRNLTAARGGDLDAQLSLVGFLSKWQAGSDESISILRNLVAEHPNDLHLLDTYATFLRTVANDRTESERVYKGILAKAPNQANTLGNYAQLLLWDGRIDEGRALLDRALTVVDASAEASSTLLCELYFYQFAHLPEARDSAIRKLKHLLLIGCTSGGWDLDPDVVRATGEAHPQPALLRIVADVIVGRRDLRALREDAEWNAVND